MSEKLTKLNYLRAMFSEDLEEVGWDFAVSHLENGLSKDMDPGVLSDIKVFISIYDKAYQLYEYQLYEYRTNENPDVDGGMIFKIRQFAITSLLEVMYAEEINDND